MTNIQNITFESLDVSKNIVQAITKKGYIIPTIIQQKIIPLFLNGSDNIIGKARTGTGKTAAFVIPIIQNIILKNNSIQALVLTPTRELAIQVSEEFKTFGGIDNLLTVCVFGGQPINTQIKQLSLKPDIVVGTPGRIIDLIHRKKLDISKLTYFVLDEADEMLNIGFINDIEEIIKETPKKKKMLFLSATMPKPIINIAKKYMGAYKYVSIDDPQEDIKLTKLTDQFYVEVPNNLKFECLCRIIDSADDFYGIIFCARKETSNNIANKLISNSYNCSVIHGDILQEQRIKIMNRFKKHELNLLIATDVAARGLDINNLTHVINYDIPQDPDSYTHRIGRTGRAGKKGIAITLVTNSEVSKIRFITKITGVSMKQMTLLTSNEISLLKQEKLINHISNLTKKEEDKDELIFQDFSQKLITQCNENINKILACILKDSYSKEILLQEKDLKIDELLLKNNDRDKIIKSNKFKKSNQRVNQRNIKRNKINYIKK